MEAPKSTPVAATVALLVLLLFSGPRGVEGRSLEVIQSRRQFDLAKGGFGGPLETRLTKFLDTEPEWTEAGCLDLPISDKTWVVDRIDYNPSNVNPDFRWFLKSIVLFPGPNCKTTYHGAPPPPIRIDIENFDDLSSAPSWLQERNYPYFGITYDPEVDPGTVTILDPQKLLGRPMSIKEKLDAMWDKGFGYLEKLEAEEADREQRVNFDELAISPRKRQELEVEARRTMSKLETTQYDIWPQYQFFGKVSIRLEWDKEVFHVDPNEEWTNRIDLGEETITGYAGSFIDGISD
ncbi:hypothetical protein TWF730_009826 [Orbilia blumenaviensis]|uniref:Uncharacterized protein n=1 Tax=Orbilia blumenaviensis TaxID=1796055 RepID=A0AAV9USV5_9PEZI